MNEIKLATINNVAIVVTDDNDQLVPLRPICDALGIDFEGQRQRLKRDEIFSSVTFMTKATGSDGKEYEMFCLPIEFVFGWLFSIDTNRVSEDVRPNIIKYKLECHKVLYQHFNEPKKFLKEKETAVAEMMKIKNKGS